MRGVQGPKSTRGGMAHGQPSCQPHHPLPRWSWTHYNASASNATYLLITAVAILEEAGDMLGQSPFAPLDTATSTTISLCLCSYQTNETCTLETPSHTGTSFTTRDIPNHRLLDQCATWRPPVQWFSSQEPQRGVV